VLSLCLSRACLGKMSIYIYKWRENTVLTHHSRGWTSEPVHMTSSHFFLAECGEPGRIKFCIPMILAASCRTQSAERRAARRPRSQTDKVVREKTERKVPEMERRRRKRRSSAHTACFPFVSSGQCTFQCPCKKKTHLSLSFQCSSPYACPEPVLVEWSFFALKTDKEGVSFFLTVWPQW
jgi:hypothetical protein